MGLGRWKGAVMVGLRAGQKRFSLKMCFPEQTPEEVKGVSDAGPCSQAHFSAAQRVASGPGSGLCSVHKRLQVPGGSWPCQRAKSQP